MWVDEWRYNITIDGYHLKHHDVDGVFGFYQYEYESVLRLMPKHNEIFVLDFQIWMLCSTASCF